MQITVATIPNIPMIEKGDDLVAMITAALTRDSINPRAGDVFVIAQKIVSKAEGRLVDLTEVTPSSRAQELGQETNKDPRLVELILAESTEVVRHRKDVLIVAHRLGLVHANAGIDQSNVDGNETALLLPVDPDASAATIRQGLEAKFGGKLGVIICDSMGRAWRKGTVGVAIGVSGLEALQDLRGTRDLYGVPLEITEVGHADQLAAAASIVMGQAGEGAPVAIISGLTPTDHDHNARDLLRPKSEDLFR